MDFLTFVKQNSKQSETDILSFINAIKNIDSIPASSDPRLLGRYLHLKLNHQQTLGFQKCMMFYKAICKNNELPEELQNDEKAFLGAINLIVELQNNNPNYKP
ncbi:MAG: hypothetical protein PHD97_00645 [Bacteroidales bacterium]|nr:hypothetical protein [Bacteroidales bacterium]